MAGSFAYSQETLWLPRAHGRPCPTRGTPVSQKRAGRDRLRGVAEREASERNMRPVHLGDNLLKLRGRLEAYAAANGIPVPSPVPPEAKVLSESLYLAHSTSSRKFSGIAGSGRLLTAAQLAAATEVPLRPDSDEALLGTADSVFLYVGPFRYPYTGCGLLFARSLEEHRKEDGVATPFDSGGLVSRFTRPDPSEPPRAFLSRHELPIPGHRGYLGLSLGVLFGKPMNYVDGVEPRWPGPIGLSGGDRRRWTHEVRIPEQVWLRTGHLQAVFAPTSRVAADPEIGQLFEWCKREGVDHFSFPISRGDDFEALQRVCLEYIRARLQ